MNAVDRATAAFLKQEPSLLMTSSAILSMGACLIVCVNCKLVFGVVILAWQTDDRSRPLAEGCGLHITVRCFGLHESQATS